MGKLDEFVCYSQINVPDLVTLLRNVQGDSKTEDGNRRLKDAFDIAAKLMEMSEEASVELGQSAGSAMND